MDAVLRPPAVATGESSPTFNFGSLHSSEELLLVEQEEEELLQLEAIIPEGWEEGELITWRNQTGKHRVMINAEGRRPGERVYFYVARSIVEPEEAEKAAKPVCLECDIPANWDTRSSIMTTVPSGNKLKILPPPFTKAGSTLWFSVPASIYDGGGGTQTSSGPILETKADSADREPCVFIVDADRKRLMVDAKRTFGESSPRALSRKAARTRCAKSRGARARLPWGPKGVASSSDRSLCRFPVPTAFLHGS